MQRDHTSFDHETLEAYWIKYWEDHQLFVAKDDNRPTFLQLIPPPNVTDRLHMGHGLNNTLQDVLVRWKRMSGFNCAWIPGTDHAGIATQMMVEKDLQKEGKKKEDFTRDEFIERCKGWKEEHGGVIIEQLKRLGCSLDWSRLAYTMDPQRSHAVRHMFVKLYKAGLIYRGERLVNWDPVLQTAISDDEVDNQELNGVLYTFSYPIYESNEVLSFATTRPETMFGDVALAVHPDDERYQHLIGKFAIQPLLNKKIPIIQDTYVKRDYGTGCVKITPAHDPNDFLIGQRHNLSMICIMDKTARMNDHCPESFQGLDRFDARKKCITAMQDLGLFVKDEKIKHTVPISDRSKAIIEPWLSKQWFVDMKTLADPAIEAANSGQLRFFPSSYHKTYDYWLTNIKDWCISRQLWWGHRIPIWTCETCQTVMTGLVDPTICKACGHDRLNQDEDVLDTWFSSWLWPLSTLNWPTDQTDFDRFHPSQVLITGPDIIFLWVARMVMGSQFATQSLPFRDVYFNAIICDKQGRKFSKTLKNGIDPLLMIKKHGSDAVRYTCLSLAPLGGRIKMQESDFEVGHRFVHKIWNAWRFLKTRILNLNDQCDGLYEQLNDYPDSLKWLVYELNKTSLMIDSHLENYRFQDALEAAHHMIWHHFCDWGLEISKVDVLIYPRQEKKVLVALASIFDQSLRLLSPFMPFVTEHIWQDIQTVTHHKHAQSIAITTYPKSSPDEINKLGEQTEIKAWGHVMQIVSNIRSLTSQAKMAPNTVVEAMILTEDQIRPEIQKYERYILALGQIDQIIWLTTHPTIPSLVKTSTHSHVYLSAEGLVSIELEVERLQKEQQRLKKLILQSQTKLNDSTFISHAPIEVKAKTKASLENLVSQEGAISLSLTYLTIT